MPRSPVEPEPVVRLLKDEPNTRVELITDRAARDDEARVEKTYRNRGLALLQTFARRSRARREHDNLRAVEALGVPCTQALAYSEHRRFGLVFESTLVTRYLPDTVPMKRVLAELPREREFAVRRRLLAAMARLVADLHRGGLLWGTAMPRNVLIVGEAKAARLAVCDVPGAVRVAHSLHGSALARLDLFDAAFSPSRRRDLSATERLRWLLAYCADDRAMVTRLWRSLAHRTTVGHDLQRAFARAFLLYLGQGRRSAT